MKIANHIFLFKKINLEKWQNIAFKKGLSLCVKYQIGDIFKMEICNFGYNYCDFFSRKILDECKDLVSRSAYNAEPYSALYILTLEKPKRNKKEVK